MIKDIRIYNEPSRAFVTPGKVAAGSMDMDLSRYPIHKAMGHVISHLKDLTLGFDELMEDLDSEKCFYIARDEHVPCHKGKYIFADPYWVGHDFGGGESDRKWHHQILIEKDISRSTDLPLKVTVVIDTTTRKPLYMKITEAISREERAQVALIRREDGME